MDIVQHNCVLTWCWPNIRRSLTTQMIIHTLVQLVTYLILLDLCSLILWKVINQLCTHVIYYSKIQKFICYIQKQLDGPELHTAFGKLLNFAVVLFHPLLFYSNLLQLFMSNQFPIHFLHKIHSLLICPLSQIR